MPLPLLSNGDACSDAAAESMVEHAPRLRRQVWLHVRAYGPMTCDAVEDALRLAHQTCSARICELHSSGCLERVGKFYTRSGRKAHLYAATKIEPL